MCDADVKTIAYVQKAMGITPIDWIMDLGGVPAMMHAVSVVSRKKTAIGWSKGMTALASRI